jgi:hypothetical protein
MNRNMPKLKVLTVARDAGAASALAPVVRTLIDDGAVSVTVVAFRYAEAVFRHFGLPLWAVADDGSVEGVAERLLSDEKPAFVLTGTSMKPLRDAAFWRRARERSIPTLAVLDHWAHYAERFSDPDGPPFSYLPDVVAVMDESARAVMISQGCPAERVTVTSQPAFDDFDSLTPEAERNLREVSRRELAVSSDDILMVFASEAIAKHFGADENSPLFLGYTETDALRVILEASRVLPKDVRRRLRVIVKLHPMEGPERLQPFVNEFADLHVRILQHFPPKKLIAASDVVTGMTSIFLLEAALFGRPSISVEPRCSVPHSYITHQGGLIQRANDLDTCRGLLSNAIAETDSDRKERRRLAIARGFDGLASRRIAAMIYERLGIAGAVGVRLNVPALVAAK